MTKRNHVRRDARVARHAVGLAEPVRPGAVTTRDLMEPAVDEIEHLATWLDTVATPDAAT